MSDPVRLELTRDEALVLFEYLTRTDEEDALTFVDQAEQRALWNLESLLQKQLRELFDPRYGELLKAARERLRDPAD